MNDEWEEVPTEDLWEDGEISRFRCMIKIFKNVVEQGDWKVVRRREWKPLNKYKQTPTIL